MCNLFRLASLSKMHLMFLYAFSWLDSSVFFIPNEKLCDLPLGPSVNQEESWDLKVLCSEPLLFGGALEGCAQRGCLYL